MSRKSKNNCKAHTRNASSASDANKIAQIFNIRPSFLRSVNVSLDYEDPASSLHYVVTDFVRELLIRLSASLRPLSTERAWRITGDYGSGKSAFALCFSRVAAGKKQQLPRELQAFVPKDLRLEPILVSGHPESLEESIRKGLCDMRRRLFRRPVKALEGTTHGHEELFDLIDAHIAELRDQRIADGVILVLDELGQNLHHAALHPGVGDISLLQTLGEKADRSKSKPFVVLALLHQGLNAYSADLDIAARREWEKVAGRYKEIVFAQPIDQVAVLVSEMLGIQEGVLSKETRHGASIGMERAMDGGFYGAAPATRFLIELAPRFYPLHPTVLPILLRLLRRFGQNERSLVGFLSSYEPFGFREFGENNHVGGDFFRLNNLYDYFRANLSRSLFNGNAAHWEVIEATVSQAESLGEPAISILKTIGLVNLINDPALFVTEATVRACVGGTGTEGAFKKLKDSASIIHERGDARGLSLWPHSSVNLDNAIDAADQALAGELVGARSVAAYLPPRAVVARRHYIETGNLRHFATSYLDIATFKECIAKKFPEDSGADGQIFVILTNDGGEADEAIMAAEQFRDKLSPMVLIGVSTPVTGIAEIIRDLKRWQWIKSNLQQLAGDIYARNHVNRELKRCQNKIEKELHHLVELRDSPVKRGTIIWIDRTGRIQSSRTKGILPHLSKRCDEVFKLCPKVANELINRRVTSSAASKARSILIEAIAVNGGSENLGFDVTKSPPEFSIYLSVLKRGHLHVKDGKAWRFRSGDELLGDDPLRVGPSIRHIHKLLLEADTKRCSVTTLFAELRAAPFGVRDGILPLLLAIYLAGHWDQTALYEDGTFMEKPGADVFQRLAKEPEVFDFQHCSIRGLRRELFNQVAVILGLPETRKPDVLQVVRPLMVFAGRLPEYSVHAQRHLEPKTRKMRDAIFQSREPITLLFHALPIALSFEPFAVASGKMNAKDAQAFAEALNAAVLDLRESYPRLLHRITLSALSAFRFQGTVAEFRKQFSLRLTAVAHSLTDPELRVFANRVGDPSLAEREWSESVGTYVANKSPERWRDVDEDEFHSRVAGLASRFARAEAAGFNGKVVDPEKLGRAVRFTLTRPDGREVDQVIHWTSKEEAELKKARTELDRLMARLGPTGMAAAAQFVWDAMEKTKPKA